MSAEWINLSHPIYPDMPRSKPHGDVVIWVDEPDVRPAHVRITHLEMAAHVGTHIDAACHFVPGGKSIDQYPLEHFVGPGVALDLPRDGVTPVTVADLEAADPQIQDGDIVLLHFGYAERFATGDMHGHPYLTTEAAQWLVDRNVPVLGVDVFTPDLPDGSRPEGFNWPVHQILLGNDTLIIENLGPGVRDVVGHRLEILAVPFAIAGGDASPLVPLARIVG